MPITAQRTIAANEDEERKGLLFVLLVRGISLHTNNVLFNLSD
jgi:hypothetical protein